MAKVHYIQTIRKAFINKKNGKKYGKSMLYILSILCYIWDLSICTKKINKDNKNPDFLLQH